MFCREHHVINTKHTALRSGVAISTREELMEQADGLKKMQEAKWKFAESLARIEMAACKRASRKTQFTIIIACYSLSSELTVGLVES